MASPIYEVFIYNLFLEKAACSSSLPAVDQFLLGYVQKYTSLC